MRCPSCRLPLLTAEVDGVELDYCAEELGVWFDRGEIEELFATRGPVLELGPSGEKGKRRCPRCNTKMRLYYPVPELELDICPRGDGIWFDAGEVRSLAEALAGRDDQLERARLDQIFARLTRMLGGTS